MVTTIGKPIAVVGDFFSFSLFVCLLFVVNIDTDIDFLLLLLFVFFFFVAAGTFFIFVPS